MEDFTQPLMMNSGHAIPRVGLGVYKSADGDETYNAVRWALEAGYRHIDTAALYANEESVGRAVHDSGIPRDQLFITTKVWNDDIKARTTRAAFETSMGKLGLDYLDLYLIHWPVDGYQDAWREMEKLVAEGRVRSIGVSNFKPHHIKSLEQVGMITPAMNQIEIHPLYANAEDVAWCRENGIAVTAWRPLGGGNVVDELANPALTAIAEAHGKTPAQVAIRWHLQRGIVAIPKSVHEERVKQNFDVFDFELTDSEMDAIRAIDTGKRFCFDPDDVAAKGGFK